MNCFVEIKLVFRLEFGLKTMFKTVFECMFKTLFKTVFEKIKNIANKNMSFLKITDPKKRYFIVNEFLKTRQNIQQIFLSEGVCDLSRQYEFSIGNFFV